MAEGRMINRRISSSKKFGDIQNDAARSLYLIMYPHLDVDGRISGDAKWLKGNVLTYCDDWDEEKIEQCLVILDTIELIKWYEADGNKCIQVNRFHDFNKVNKEREARSRIPLSPMSKRRCFTKKEYEYAWSKWDKTCPICKKTATFVPGSGLVIGGYVKFQIDHIVPLSKGGTYALDNLRVICQKCNARKGQKLYYSGVSPDNSGVSPDNSVLKESNVMKSKVNNNNSLIEASRTKEEMKKTLKKIGVIK